MKNPLRNVLLAALFVAVFWLTLPWAVEGFHKYSDWVYCQTHEPFVDHGWNTNWHHCPVAS